MPASGAHLRQSPYTASGLCVPPHRPILSTQCFWHIRQFVTLTEPRGWLSNLEDFNSFIGFARASPTLRDKVLATRHRNGQGNNGRPYLSSLSVHSGIKLTCQFHAACKEDGIVRYVKDLASSARGLKRLDLLVE